MSETVLDEVGNEREKQRKRWGDDHDDGNHRAGGLAAAGACYAVQPFISRPWFWPWPKSDWRPEPTRRLNLVKAAALIVAEIERIDRQGASDE